MRPGAGSLELRTDRLKAMATLRRIAPDVDDAVLLGEGWEQHWKQFNPLHAEPFSRHADLNIINQFLKKRRYQR